MLRVALCDDALGFPELVTAWLAAAPDTELVARTDTWTELVGLLPEVQPDVVLLDFMLPEGPADAERMAALRAAVPGVRIVLLSSLPVVQLEDQARELGADAWVSKAAEAPDVLGALRPPD